MKALTIEDVLVTCSQKNMKKSSKMVFKVLKYPLQNLSICFSTIPVAISLK